MSITTEPDYDRVMRANLSRVFGEQQPAARLAAIQELYEADAVLHEPHASSMGHAAINDAVSALLASLPSNFVFIALGPAIGHHDIGRLKWGAGPADGPPAAHGMDIAHLKGNRIHSLFVFLEPDNA